MTCATTLYGLRNCDTVRKARAWLDEHRGGCKFHDFRKDGLTPDRLHHWVDAVGWEPLLNRAGTTFRKLADADKIAIDRDKAMALMLAQPSLVKRPVVEHAGRVVVGFTPDRYTALFATA